MARLVTLPKKIVAPSGLALAARRAPIICVAPGLLSTTGLAGLLRKHVRHGTWQNVSDAAGGIGYDDGDDPVVLRRSRCPEDGRQCRHGKGAGKRGAEAKGRGLHGEGFRRMTMVPERPAARPGADGPAMVTAFA